MPDAQQGGSACTEAGGRVKPWSDGGGQRFRLPPLKARSGRKPYINFVKRQMLVGAEEAFNFQ